MGEAKTFTGGCHCGRVRYEVRLELGPVLACNCSICAMKAPLLTFGPAAAFTLVSGEEALGEYRFNRQVIAHLFCRTCGVESFARLTQEGQPLVAVNTRCLDGVDAASLPVRPFDGKSVPRVDR